MDFTTMSVQELQERRQAIAQELETADADKLNELEAEARGIKEELETRKAAEAQRAAIRDAVAQGDGEVTNTFKPTEARKTMNEMEIRNSQQYIDAFAQYVKTGDDSECRALLTDNINTGTVPVPEFVYGIVSERVKASRILSRVRRMEVKGNVKVGFEISAPAAAIHAENAAAVAEEALTLGIVTLIPGAAKKWVQFSDEVMDNSEAFLRYIYDEISRGIIKAREKAIIDAILAAPQTATRTAPAVAKTGTAVTGIADIVNARALLSGAAEDLVVIVSPADYARYKGFQLGANHSAADPFDGLEVIVTEYATAPIVGDLSGAMENLPNGDAVEFKLDNTTLMTSDMVRLLGRTPVASAVVGNLFFAKVAE